MQDDFRKFRIYFKNWDGDYPSGKTKEELVKEIEESVRWKKKQIHHEALELLEDVEKLNLPEK